MKFLGNDKTCQELTQKEKVLIHCEKVAQIDVLANKIVT